MRICVFSDIHGNISFFEQLLAAMKDDRPDRLVFLGDCVSYHPHGLEVIHRLREIGADCVEGNHDSMLRGDFPEPMKHEPVYQLQPAIQSISGEDLAFVKSWPEVRDEVIDGLRVEFVHGSPLDHLKGYTYEDSELALFDSPDLDIVFMGHTHRPWIHRNAHTLMVNVGSVGLPRDEGGGSRPSYALFDSKTGAVEIKRIDADISAILAERDRIHETVIDCLYR